MIVKRNVEMVDGHVVETVKKITAKKLAREIVIDMLCEDGICKYAEGLDRGEWGAMNPQEQQAVTDYYNQYINRLLRVMGHR